MPIKGLCAELVSVTKRKKQQNQRNLIEGKFGQAKNAYGLSDIQARRSDTSESWIGAIFFVMNLIKLQKIAKKYAIFCALFKNWIQFKIFTPAKALFYKDYNLAFSFELKYLKFEP